MPINIFQVRSPFFGLLGLNFVSCLKLSVNAKFELEKPLLMTIPEICTICTQVQTTTHIERMGTNKLQTKLPV